MLESTSLACDRPARVCQFQSDRFGLSLHLGAYSVPARGEWVRAIEKLSEASYQPYVDSFSPHRDWARDWAKMAREAGARYGVLTTKHHDGFCLFDSQLTSYSTAHSACGRDLVREFVEALRDEGLKVGLYYSLVDWHHPDFPAWQDRQHPLRHVSESQARDAAGDWDRYVSYLHGQVEELCRNYGKLDQLVFDFSYWQYSGEKWGATELLKKIRRLQPEVLINDRLSNEALKQVPRPTFAGDYEQCEQNIPKEALKDASGQEIPWEGWFTLNNSWCFNPHDQAWKSAVTVIRALINCVSKNGNLLLNVSPDARGNVPEQARGILREVGEWLRLNGESVYEAGASGFEKPEWGRFTLRGNYLYAHLLEPVVGHITLPGLRGVVKNGELLAHGSEAPICDFWNPGIQTFDAAEDIFFNLGPSLAATYPLPDSRSTVIRFELTTDAEREALREKYRIEKVAALERKAMP